MATPSFQFIRNSTRLHLSALARNGYVGSMLWWSVSCLMGRCADRRKAAPTSSHVGGRHRRHGDVPGGWFNILHDDRLGRDRHPLLLDDYGRFGDVGNLSPWALRLGACVRSQLSKGGW